MQTTKTGAENDVVTTASSSGEGQEISETAATTAAEAAIESEILANQPGMLRVIRRNGKVTPFDPTKIAVALTKAFLAIEGGTGAASASL